MAEDILAQAKQLVTRRVDFIKARQPDHYTFTSKAKLLNPGNKRFRAPHSTESPTSGADAESDEQGAGAEVDEGDSAQRRKLEAEAKQHSLNADDDDPLHNRPESVFAEPLQSTGRSWGHGTSLSAGAGLRNCGNTCYLNSVLQCIAHTPQLSLYLQAMKPHSRHTGVFDPLVALGTTVTSIFEGGGRAGAVQPREILRHLRAISKQLRMGEQCDAQEFAGALLDSCQVALLKRKYDSRKLSPQSQHTSPLMRIIGGYLRSSVQWRTKEEYDALRKAKNAAWSSLGRCTDEYLRSNTYEPFSMLNLPVVGHSIEDCLGGFCRLERLDGKIYRTPREVHVNAEKGFTIHSPPNVLIIHLKRFNNRARKVTKPIRFSNTLNMTPFTSNKRKKTTYTLCGVVVHHGSSMQYGHYTAFVLGRNNLWYQCDDERVAKCSLDSVLRSEAYMLWYSLDPPPSPDKKTPISGKFIKMPHPQSVETAPAVMSAEDLGKEVGDEEVAAIVQRQASAREKALAKEAVAAAEESPAASESAASPTAPRPPLFTVPSWNSDVSQSQVPPKDEAEEHARKRTREDSSSSSSDDDGSPRPTQSLQKKKVARGGDAAYQLRAATGQEVRTLKPHAHEGKFVYRTRDEEYNREMDKPRQKKLKKEKKRIALPSEHRKFQHVSDAKRLAKQSF